MGKNEKDLPRWAKVPLFLIFAGIIIWAIVPGEALYISLGIALAVIGGVSYLVYRKWGTRPFKTLAKGTYKWLTESRKQASIEKVPSLTSSERGLFINAVGNRCENPNCNKTQFLEVHHIIPRGEGGSNRRNNLIVLCPTCHRAAGHAYGRGQLQSWIRRPRRFRFNFYWQYK